MKNRISKPFVLLAFTAMVVGSLTGLTVNDSLAGLFTGAESVTASNNLYASLDASSSMKCGSGSETEKKSVEGKCGDGKAVEKTMSNEKADAKEKCGTGKCGDGKASEKTEKMQAEHKSDTKEAKCGTGKCGDGKTSEKAEKMSPEKKADTKEAKCGSGKCGDGKAPVKKADETIK